MKKIILLSTIIIFTSVICVNAQPYADKDGQYDQSRNTYLMQTYNLSLTQIDSYNKALKIKANAVDLLFSRSTTRKERNAERHDLYLEFKTQVKQILSAEQFAKWDAAYKDNDQTRRYKEYLGLTDEGVSRLREIIKIYHADLKRISTLLISSREKRDERAKASKEKDKALVALLGDKKAEEMSRYMDINHRGMIMRDTWPFLPYNATEKMAVLYLQYDKEYGDAECSGKDVNTINKEIRAAQKKYQDAIKATLTTDQYSQLQAAKNQNQDDYIIRNYQLTSSQLKKYKDVMNNRAINIAVISKSRISQQEKNIKYDSINRAVQVKLSSALSPEQAEVWFKNINKQ